MPEGMTSRSVDIEAGDAGISKLVGSDVSG